MARKLTARLGQMKGASLSEQTHTALTQPESDALETLFEAAERAAKAFAFARAKFSDGGEVQRLGPGMWVVTRRVIDADT